MANISIEHIAKSKISNVDFDNIPFGRVFTDHMFIVDFSDGEWKNPRIQPYGPLPLSPALSCMHYGQAIFEGMKAHRTHDDGIQLFRPLDNHKRLNTSARRLCMPELPEEIFMQGMETWLSLDQNWVPQNEGSSLYIRPFMIATDDYLGVKPSAHYSFMIYGCPVGAYYTTPLRIRIEEKYVRAAHGGVGYAKAAGNYAAAMYPASLAQKEGYHQLLWTDAFEHKYLEELGTSNFFALIDGKLITPTLDGTILDGITRDSVIEVAKSMGFEIIEKRFEVAELIQAAENGTLTEAFATGTAATIARIETINFRGKDYHLSLENHSNSVEISNKLNNIKTGNISDPFNWTYEVPLLASEA
jgi:branched-chain amino acid aminotransferase